MTAAPQLSACTTGFIGSSVLQSCSHAIVKMCSTTHLLNAVSRKSVSRSVKCGVHQSSNTKVHSGGEVHLLRTTQLRIQTLEASRQGALHGVLWVGQEVAVEGPAEGEEIQRLAALPLSRGADGAAGLEDATLWAALGQKHSTHQPAQGLEARQLHQHLDGKMEKKGVCEVERLAWNSWTEAIATSLCGAVNVCFVLFFFCFFYQVAQFLRKIQQQQGNKRKSCKFWGQLLYPVLSQECGGFSLISNGQPDVWERGEVVAQTLTHLHLDELARRCWEHKEKESILLTSRTFSL